MLGSPHMIRQEQNTYSTDLTAPLKPPTT
jgi:hypothetical protein